MASVKSYDMFYSAWVVFVCVCCLVALLAQGLHRAYGIGLAISDLGCMFDVMRHGVEHSVWGATRANPYSHH